MQDDAEGDAAMRREMRYASIHITAVLLRDNKFINQELDAVGNTRSARSTYRIASFSSSSNDAVGVASARLLGVGWRFAGLRSGG